MTSKQNAEKLAKAHLELTHQREQALAELRNTTAETYQKRAAEFMNADIDLELVEQQQWLLDLGYFERAGIKNGE